MNLPFRVAALVVVASALVGCTPRTVYRYSALTPSPQPIAWDGRGSGEGSLHLEGEIQGATLGVSALPRAAELHATALWVPRVSAGGAALLEVVDGVSLGVHGSYASYAWSDMSTVGTMPLPEHPSLFGFGPQLRLTARDHDERFALGVAAGADFYGIPYVEWTAERCLGQAGCVVAPLVSSSRVSEASYRLTNTDSELHTVLDLDLYPSVGLGTRARYGSLFGLAGVSQGFRNDGFTNTKSGDGKVGEYAVFLFGGGYGFHADFLHVAFGAYVPVSGASNAVDYTPAAYLTLGLDPRLWTPRARRFD